MRVKRVRMLGSPALYPCSGRLEVVYLNRYLPPHVFCVVGSHNRVVGNLVVVVLVSGSPFLLRT